MLTRVVNPKMVLLEIKILDLLIKEKYKKKVLRRD